MSGFKTLSGLLGMLAIEGHSRHKIARAQRFLFRHRTKGKHPAIVQRVIAAQQAHQRNVTASRILRRASWAGLPAGRGALKRRRS